jgi:predicted TIM-barrel fold metal-dependent hydrolase
MLLATDHPYEDSDECMAFLEGLPIPMEDKDKILMGNAKKMLKID